MSIRKLMQRLKPGEPQLREPSTTSPAEDVFWRPIFHPSHPVSREWEHKVGHGENGWGNNELQYYSDAGEHSFHTPNNKLVIRAIQSGPSSTSARLVSRTRLTHARGHLSATISLPCAQGIWPAFWLLPSEPFNWPNDGEIDIAETWNRSMENHACLHWGHYTPQDANKHRVAKNVIPDMDVRPIKFDLYWDEPARKLVWLVDGRPVMREEIPKGLRPMADWNILLNVAMGGNVCDGQRPIGGAYEMVIHEMTMSTIEAKAIDNYYSKARPGKPL